MATGSHNILSKVDRAIAAYLIASGAGTSADVHPAKRSEDKTVPCTVVYSSRAVLTHPFSGTYEVTSAIMIKTNAAIDTDDFSREAPKDRSEERVTLTFDAMFKFGTGQQSGEELAAAITSAAQGGGGFDLGAFTIQDVEIVSVEAGFDPNKMITSTWIDTLDLKLICCPAAVG